MCLEMGRGMNSGTCSAWWVANNLPEGIGKYEETMQQEFDNFEGDTGIIFHSKLDNHNKYQ